MKYILPKGYLSSSQIDMWESSKATYRKTYYENAPRITTPEMRFGSESAANREKGIHDEIPEHLRYDLPEFKLDVLVEGVRCIGAIDCCHSSFKMFREDKTGVKPWTDVLVQKREQLVMYATLLKYQTGIMPDYCDLVWIETKRLDSTGVWSANKKVIVATGYVKSFRRNFEKKEIDRMVKKILRVAQDISEDYNRYLSEI